MTAPIARRLCGCLALMCPLWAPAGDAEHGRYVLAAAGCAACHTVKDGAFLAGGRALRTPFGTFYTPNITPHREYGLGKWTESEFITALREGVGPSHRYFPVFPYTSYTRMSRADASDLWAYLQTVPAVAQPNRPHDLAWYLVRPLAVRAWQWLFFKEGAFQPDPTRSDEWNRGAYLVTALGHCGECHTPRDAWGSMDETRALSGNAQGPEGDPVPNLTPDRSTGLGRWSARDIVWYLETGATPGGDYAGGLMAEVIDNDTSHLTAADRQAIAVYLKTLPTIANPALKKR